MPPTATSFAHFRSKPLRSLPGQRHQSFHKRLALGKPTRSEINPLPTTLPPTWKCTHTQALLPEKPRKSPTVTRLQWLLRESALNHAWNLRADSEGRKKQEEEKHVSAKNVEHKKNHRPKNSAPSSPLLRLHRSGSLRISSRKAAIPSRLPLRRYLGRFWDGTAERKKQQLARLVQNKGDPKKMFKKNEKRGTNSGEVGKQKQNGHHPLKRHTQNGHPAPPTTTKQAQHLALVATPTTFRHGKGNCPLRYSRSTAGSRSFPQKMNSEAHSPARAINAKNTLRRHMKLRK